MGSDWFSDNVTIANRVSGAWWNRKEEGEEVELTKGCSEGKRPRNKRPLPGAGRDDVKNEKEIKI